MNGGNPDEPQGKSVAPDDTEPHMVKFNEDIRDATERVIEAIRRWEHVSFELLGWLMAHHDNLPYDVRLYISARLDRSLKFKGRSREVPMAEDRSFYFPWEHPADAMLQEDRDLELIREYEEIRREYSATRRKTGVKISPAEHAYTELSKRYEEEVETMKWRVREARRRRKLADRSNNIEL